jgi:phosphoglycolate phosphatase
MGLNAVDGDRHLPIVLDRLESELAASVDLMRERGAVLPGVPDVLASLHADRGHVAQSVLTGNTAANAATKVIAFGLDRWLDLEIGAYGSDNSDRRTLVPVAIQRAADLRGWSLAPRDVWVVGDTPHDFACARAGGARSMLVATGRTPIEELLQLGADAVFEDLSDVDAVVHLLQS